MTMQIPQSMLPEYATLWKNLKGAADIQNYLEGLRPVHKNYNPAHFIQAYAGNNTASDFKRFHDGFEAAVQKVKGYLSQDATKYKFTVEQKALLEAMEKRMKTEADFWMPGGTAFKFVAELAVVKHTQAKRELQPLLDAGDRECDKLKQLYDQLPQLLKHTHDLMTDRNEGDVAANLLYRPSIDKTRQVLDQLLTVIESADKARLACKQFVDKSGGVLTSVDWAPSEHRFNFELAAATKAYKDADEPAGKYAERLAKYVQTEHDLFSKAVNPAKALMGLVNALGSPLGQLRGKSSAAAEALRPTIQFGEAWTRPLVAKAREFIAAVAELQGKVKNADTAITTVFRNVQQGHGSGWGLLLDGKAPLLERADNQVKKAAESLAAFKKAFEEFEKQAAEYARQLPKDGSLG